MIFGKKKETEEQEEAAPPVEPKAKEPPSGKSLVCTRECDMPGVGAWSVGDVVTDPELLKLLAGHPYFDSKEGA